MKGTEKCKNEPYSKLDSIGSESNQDEDIYIRSGIMTLLPKPYKYLHVIERRAEYVKSAHSHNYFQIIFVTSGFLTIYTNTMKRTLGPRHFAILHPQKAHALYSESGYSQIGIDIYNQNDPRGIIELLVASFPDPFSTGNLLNIPDTFENLFKETSNQNQFNILKITNKVESFLIEAIKQTTIQHSSFRERFLDMVSNDEGFFLTVDEMCNRMNLSKTHLERLVKKEFQYGAAEFCLNLRLIKSCYLLQETSLPIKSISEKLKFYDTAHFSRVFKKFSGMTPFQYRNKNKLDTTQNVADRLWNIQS
jgi:AraC-like DNA-binding protein